MQTVTVTATSRDGQRLTVRTIESQARFDFSMEREVNKAWNELRGAYPDAYLFTNRKFS